MGEEVKVEHAVAFPLFESGDHQPPTRARHLAFEPCPKRHAVECVRMWHSRLPNVQCGPWQYAFRAQYNGETYAVALWHNPSARTLPHHWLELRRMACAPDAPKFTASRFLMWMVRWFRTNTLERERCISYQDTAVHRGTIYKASGWTIGAVAKARIRDRSKARRGTRRMYRSNLNGPQPDAAEKIRWEIAL
jgi:hypothetical protein